MNMKYFRVNSNKTMNELEISEYNMTRSITIIYTT